MAFGIEVENNHGTLLLDATYRNLAVTSASTGGVVAVGDGRSFRFDVPTPPGPGWGAQVFTASGQCVFDSRLKYARVVDTLSGPLSGSTTHTYPAGRQYAVITNKRAVEMSYEVRDAPGSPAGWYNYRAIFRRCLPSVSGNMVTLAWGVFGTGDWSPPVQVIPTPATADYQSRFVVLDVTGY